jgi:radical SAM-linked protein
MRFTSHLDVMRAWERSLRRSGLPLAFSQGHHPHLKMSFGPPLPLGHRSRAEVFDLEFTRPPGVDLAACLNAVLPEGLQVLDVRPILFKTPSLMSQLEGASYRVRFPVGFLEEAGLAPERLLDTLQRGASELLARDHVLVRRKSEEQAREFDARGSIVSLDVGPDEPPAVLDAHVRFTPRASVRPEELVGLLIPSGDPRTVDIERTELWSEVGGRRLDPLALLSARS